MNKVWTMYMVQLFHCTVYTELLLDKLETFLFIRRYPGLEEYWVCSVLSIHQGVVSVNSREEIYAFMPLLELNNQGCIFSWRWFLIIWGKIKNWTLKGKFSFHTYWNPIYCKPIFSQCNYCKRLLFPKSAKTFLFQRAP